MRSSRCWPTISRASTAALAMRTCASSRPSSWLRSSPMRVALRLADGEVIEHAAAAGLARALVSEAPAVHVLAATPTASAHQRPVVAAVAGTRSTSVGRYAGELVLDGEVIGIDPRIGWDALGGWVAAAT